MLKFFKYAYFFCLSFAMLLGCMGIFFGFVIYRLGTDIKQINTDFLMLCGAIVVSFVVSILLATPLLNPDFWSSLSEIKKREYDLYNEKKEVAKVRKHYESLIKEIEK